MKMTLSRKTFSLFRSGRTGQPARWAALGAAVLLAACANLATQPPEEQVKQRANARWQALVEGKFTEAYSYNTPGFRALVTPDSYRARTGGSVKWVGATVTKVDCPEAAKCKVQIKLDYKPLFGGKMDGFYSTYLDENWLLEASQWWIFQSIDK